MTIRRWHLTFIAVLLALAVGAALRPAVAGSPAPQAAPKVAVDLAMELAVELAQGGNIMQCMEQCIRAEGKSEMATCKSRCANISSKPPKQRDCMGNFKSCQQNCPKQDRNCKRACKDALMKCS